MRAILAFLAFGGLVKAQNCPEPYGVQVYPNEQYCDKFYKVSYTQCYFSTYFNYNFHFFLKKKCVNGTFYDETCENGLVFDGGYGAVHNFCNYNWAVDCGKRVYDDTPISSPGCLYQYGIYPVGVGCQTTFYKVSM